MNTATEDGIREVMAAEQAFRAALVAADGRQLDALLDAGFLYGHGSGRTDDKAAYIGIITNGKARIVGEALGEVSTRLYGDTALNCGDVTVTKQEAAGVKVTAYLFVTVWQRAGGGWRLVHYQHSRKREPKAAA